MSRPRLPQSCNNTITRPGSLLDTSPSEGLLVLLRQRDFDVRACGVADGVTCVPNSWLEFYAQRR